MNRSRFHLYSWILLTLCSIWAAWTWLRPYAWNPDPLARCHISGIQVRQDRSYYWLEAHLKITPGQSIDLLKPIRLIAQDGTTFEPADLTLGGTPEEGTTEIWIKFWLENHQITQPLSLKINDGTLTIRDNQGPIPSRSHTTYFSSTSW